MGSNKYNGAHKRIENVEQKLRTADQKDFGCKPEILLEELRNSGEKYNEKDIIFIVRQKNGKIAWLEEGNDSVGLKHIKQEHSKELNNKGIKDNLIPELLKEAITHGKIIGYQKTKHKFPREVYEVEFMGKMIRISISISGNGFIIGANLINKEKEIIRKDEI